MKILQVVPDHYYFVWQLYVQMLNFREYGVEQDAIILVARTGPSVSEYMARFQTWTQAKVYIYQDTRRNTQYLSSIRPHIISKFLAENRLDAFFYIDQDVIFLRPPDIDKLAGDLSTDVLAVAEMNYVAAKAETYIFAKYVDAFKNHSHLEDMAAIVGIDPAVIRAKDDLHAVGGAQYIIKNTDSAFWSKVERDCEAIYKDLYTRTLAEEKAGIYHIQIWCADMWALMYNLWLVGDTRQAPEIDFSWPWETWETAAATMHNAGITQHNENSEGKPMYFSKAKYRHGKLPFAEDLSFISPNIVQSAYVKNFATLHSMLETNKRKILAILCTTNKIHPDLLKTVIGLIKTARDSATIAHVHVVVCAWEHVPDNPFEEMITPFRDLLHMNYILQIKEVLHTHEADIVCILEHDVLYPKNYFDEVMRHWNYAKYGVWNDNYIGMNETGYLKVKQRHQPFSMMSAAKFYLEKILDQKLNECVRRIHKPDGWEVKYGWTCVEPDNKDDFQKIPFTNVLPAIHVNMNHMGGWGTGSEGKNHHFTSHCEVCYESDSKGVTKRTDWGDYAQYFPFPQSNPELIGEVG